MHTRIKKVQDLLKPLGLHGIVIESQANFGWLTGGRGFIGLSGTTACASILITKDHAYLVSNATECDRLLEEEIPEPLEALRYPWYASQDSKSLIQSICGDDYKTDGQLESYFFDLRTVLDAQQIDVYRYIAPKVADILESTMHGLKTGVTELELTGRLAKALWSIGVEPVTVLAGFDDRMVSRRHPVPTANKLQNVALAAVTVRYKGQYISCTRQIALKQIPAELQKKHDAVVTVDVAVLNATREGCTYEELFETLKDAYKAVGYPEEWQKHHQGGLTGFGSRETRAMPNNTLSVRNNQAFAWNPTIAGTKSEDTVLLANGTTQILTFTGNWEYNEINGLLRPRMLQL